MNNLLNISLLALPLLGFLFLSVSIVFNLSRNVGEKALRKPLLQLAIATFFMLAGCVGIMIYYQTNPSSTTDITQTLLYLSVAAFVVLTVFSIMNFLKASKQPKTTTNEAERFSAPVVTYDYLTQLKNCATLTDELNRTIEKAKRGGPTSSLLFIDIDNFKQFNADYGHACGDYLLTKIAEVFKKRMRKTDIVARYSGDEFVIILYNADTEQAIHLAQMLIMKLAATELTYKENSFNISCSIGVAPITANSIDAQSVIASAQEALETGRTEGNAQVRAANLLYP